MCGRFFDSVVGADYCSICCVVWPITDFHNCMYFLLLPPETQADRCDTTELPTSSNVRHQKLSEQNAIPPFCSSLIQAIRPVPCQDGGYAIHNTALQPQRDRYSRNTGLQVLCWQYSLDHTGSALARYLETEREQHSTHKMDCPQLDRYSPQQCFRSGMSCCISRKRRRGARQPLSCDSQGLP